MDGSGADKGLSNKICVYETAHSIGYIKQEPCDVEDEPGSVHNYINIKEEIIEDPTVLVQETGRITNIKENYCIYCEGCGEEYDLYCLKCPMLIRIFDSYNLKDNRVRRTLPKNFFDICESAVGVGIVALRTIPKGVVFGPFEGLDSTKDGTVSKWKLKNEELVYAKDPKRLNWMQYIRRTHQRSYRNLTPFQYEDALYYCSDFNISVGDELLVCCDEENVIQDGGDSYWKPWVCERLDDTYACTFCCVGYKSIGHLTAHNSRCPEKRNRTDFCKDIIQCASCRIYLDQTEYSDYHIDRCCESNRKCAFKTSYKLRLRHHVDARPTKCESCDAEFWSAQALGRHQKKVHGIVNKRFQCYKCEYRTNHKFKYEQHLRTHDGLKPWACAICPFKTSTKQGLKRHVTVTHNDDKPFKCDVCHHTFKEKYSLTKHLRYIHPEAGKRDDETSEYACYKCEYRTRRKGDLKQHLARVHDGLRPFACALCPHKTTTNWKLKQHIATHNDDKPFKCDACPKTFKVKSSLTEHARNVHLEAEKKEYNCTQCPFGTNYKESFVHHVNAHNQSQLFRCSKCDFSTYHRRTFNRHRIRHEREQMYACHVCSFRTNDAGELDDHLRTHDSVKPFEYDEGSKSMEDIDEIRAENRAFDGRERPKLLDCPTCGMTFNFKGHLTRHIKRLHAFKVKEEKSSIKNYIQA